MTNARLMWAGIAVTVSGFVAAFLALLKKEQSASPEKQQMNTERWDQY